MSIAELARLASGAHCVVGVDTGLAHLSAAFGVAVVGIYGGSDPALTGLYGAARVRSLGGVGRPPAVQEVLDVLEAIAAPEAAR
jgi:heptosyltransferase-1